MPIDQGFFGRASEFAEGMGYTDNIVPGWVPLSGAIFASNIGTKKECFRQKLFGLPSSMSKFVLHVKKGMILFLFEFERRQLYGVFRATSDGEINIVPTAFKSSGRHFPAQVRFTSVWNCNPLDESEFRNAIRDNYFSGKKFNFGLSEDQVYKLMMLFHTKRIPKNHPERNIWKYDDKPAEGDGRFDDHRTNLFRDRLGFISKEDSYDLDIYKYLGNDDKEVDDHDFMEEVNNFNRSRGQRNRILSVERLQEDNGDRFLTNYTTQSDDFGDHSTRQAILGNHLDHSLGGLRRGITNEDSFFMMEKIKVEHDIGDDRHFFTEPHGHFGKIGAESSGITRNSKEFVDDNRIEDEYHVINDFWQTIDDGRPFGYESEQGTLNIKPNYDEGSRTYTASGIKPRYDYKDFGFGDVSPTNTSIRGVVSTNYIAFSHSKQNTSGNPISEAQDSDQLRHASEFSNIGKTYDCNLPYSTCCDTRMITPPIPYDSEAPDIQLRSSNFAPGSSSSLVDNCPFYPSSEDALLGKNHDTVACHETRGTHLVEGNPVFKTNTFEGSFFSEHASLSLSLLSRYDNSYLGEPRSRYIHKVSESSLASGKPSGLCPREDDPICQDKIFRRPREDKCVNEPDKRVSVFARLSLVPEAARREQELDSGEHEGQDESINNVMNMLEKVVSGPIKRSEKSISAFKHDDDDKIASKIVDCDLSKVKMESDADLADETFERGSGSGSILHETRLVDFKRRKKANKNLDDKSKENTDRPIESERSAGNRASEPDAGSAETNSLMGMPCKRRRLVRPIFVRDEPTADSKHSLPTSNENTSLKDDSNPTKAVESVEKVEASIESVQVSAECQKDVTVESMEKVDTSLESVQVSAECQKDVTVESVEKVDTSLESVQVSAECQKDVTVESVEKVDTSLESVQVLAECQKDVTVESVEKVDTFLESVQVSAKCPKDDIEGEASSEAGNADNGQVLDGNEKCDVDGMIRVGSPKDDQKMCGWIEW